MNRRFELYYDNIRGKWYLHEPVAVGGYTCRCEGSLDECFEMARKLANKGGPE